MKAGLLGLGMVAGTFADACRNSKLVELTTVFSPTPARRTAFVKDHGPGLEAVGSLDALLAANIDFLIVATPPDARVEIIADAIDARMPVLMEKPIERSLTVARKIVTDCEAASLPLGIVFQHRKRRGVAQLRQMMPEFGKLHMVEMNAPWWRPQTYYDEPGRGTYERDGGGVLMTQAIHTLDLMLHLTGPVQEVTAFTGTTGQHQMEAENFASAGLRFANGALGHIFATTASYPGRGESIVLHFEYASAHLEAGILKVTSASGEVQEFGGLSNSGAGANPMDFGSERHQAIVDDFAQSLGETRPPAVTGRAALAVHELIEAIELSSKDGRRVSLHG